MRVRSIERGEANGDQDSPSDKDLLESTKNPVYRTGLLHCMGAWADEEQVERQVGCIAQGLAEVLASRTWM